MNGISDSILGKSNLAAFAFSYARNTNYIFYFLDFCIFVFFFFSILDLLTRGSCSGCTLQLTQIKI